MRDILFRGRTTEGKEWVHGYYAVYSSIPFIGAPNSYGTMLWFAVDPETVGQFTGLTDENGEKIFEGDIVTVTDEIWESPFCYGLTGKIIYDEATFFIMPKDPMETQWLFNECAVYEVIGNIYDNPKLLEV